MKRLTAVLCAAVLCLAVTGCGQSAATMAVPPREAASSRETTPAQSTTGPVTPAPSSSLSDGAARNDAASGGAALTALAAALAAYPDVTAQPCEDDYLLPDGTLDYDAFDRDYTVWLQAEAARPGLPENVSRLAAFFRAAEGQFLSGGTENRACSPLNIYFALCMMAEVSGGESRAQILRLLNMDSIDTLRAQANQVWNALYKDDGTSALIPAASLWMNKNITFRQDTVNRLAGNYFASSFSGDPSDPAFTAALQSWLNQQTRGLLEKQAGNVSLTADTVLALAATLYYKAPWLSQFEEALTRSDVFHAPSGDMRTPYMHKTYSRSTFYAGQGFTAMPLNLDTGRMWLILPDKGTSVDGLLRAGSAADLLAAPENFVSARNASVSLALPRFDVSGELDLSEGLKAMGVLDVFDAEKSNFIPLTETAKNLEISGIQHAARVKIDEEGCEAAAFTVAMVELTAAVDQPQAIAFTLDRPFLFVVEGGESLPLFMGVVNVPEAA